MSGVNHWLALQHLILRFASMKYGTHAPLIHMWRPNEITNVWWLATSKGPRNVQDMTDTENQIIFKLLCRG
jgi:hypothetical protein